MSSGVGGIYVGMYLRRTQRRRKDGSLVRYLQLAHNRRAGGGTRAEGLLHPRRGDERAGRGGGGGDRPASAGGGRGARGRVAAAGGRRNAARAARGAALRDRRRAGAVRA